MAYMMSSLRIFIWVLAMGPSWILVGSDLWAPILYMVCHGYIRIPGYGPMVWTVESAAMFFELLVQG